MNNTQIKKTLAGYFQSGDVPTEAQFEELIEAALDLSINKSLFDTRIISSVNRVVEDHIEDLAVVLDDVVTKYALVNSQKVLLVGQKKVTENGIYLFNNMAFKSLYSTTINENIADLNSLPAEIVASLTLEGEKLVRLESQEKDAENGVYRYISKLDKKADVVDVNENITDLTAIPPETVTNLGLTDNDYAYLTAQTIAEENGLYQFSGDALVESEISVAEVNFSDLSRVNAENVAQYSLSTGSQVFLHSQSNSEENGLYEYRGALIDKQTNFHLGYGVKVVKENSTSQNMWVIYKIDNQTKGTYWKQRFDLTADNITAGTLDNARLPIEISGKIFSGNGAGLTELDASNISAGTLDNTRLSAEISGKTFSGNGADLTGLNAGNISSGIVPTNNLPEASNINLGIMRFANEQELEDGNDNVAITSRALKEQVGELKLYSESQVPEILNASETVSGIIQLATQDETEAGISETTAISPAVLKNALDQQFTFIEDTGQDPNTLTISEGQIVALYTDLSGN